MRHFHWHRGYLDAFEASNFCIVLSNLSNRPPLTFRSKSKHLDCVAEGSYTNSITRSDAIRPTFDPLYFSRICREAMLDLVGGGFHHGIEYVFMLTSNNVSWGFPRADVNKSIINPWLCAMMEIPPLNVYAVHPSSLYNPPMAILN